MNPSRVELADLVPILIQDRQHVDITFAVVEIVSDFRHSAVRLWRAITGAEELTVWMDYPARVELRVGGDYFVDFRNDSEENLDGVIVAIEPERRLAYAWGLSVLEWTLVPDDENGGCRHAFLQHGMPVRGIPEEEGVASGWHAWLDELDVHLDGSTITREESGARYKALSPPYRSRIEAAIGPLESAEPG